MTRLTKRQAVDAIKELFNINGESKSTFEEVDGRTTFLIFKGEYERLEVIDKLMDYFSDKFVEDGQVRITPITLVFTEVCVEDRGYEKRRNDKE